MPDHECLIMLYIYEFFLYCSLVTIGFLTSLFNISLLFQVIILLNEFTNTEHRTPSTVRQQVIDNVNRYNTLFAAEPQSVSIMLSYLTFMHSTHRTSVVLNR